MQARLDGVERDQGVRILHAIESGSRAWGFPSPDSDYDCRFVYCHPIADYASLRPPRDVIETPLTPILDVNGWDIRKALRLGLKGNAVILEWLRSPIVYRARPGFAEAMDVLLREVVPPALVAKHYAGLAQNFAAGGKALPLKKLFYLLRPFAALEWMRDRDFAELPPMAFDELRGGMSWPEALDTEIDRLLAEKARTRELGVGEVPAVVSRELERLPDVIAAIPHAKAVVQPGAWERADAFLQQVLADETS